MSDDFPLPLRHHLLHHLLIPFRDSLRSSPLHPTDSTTLILRFLISRHKSLLPGSLISTTLPTPPGSIPANTAIPKTPHLPLSKIASTIQADWENNNYYITGHLTPSIYSSSCRFDGPDPDMPVVGLRKYLSATSNLFDHSQSLASITSLTHSPATSTITVTWALQGVIMLPWRPRVHPYTGKTVYHVGESGLVERHEEEWDISVLEAFGKTLFNVEVKGGR